jgi:hypothetical protein
MSPILRRTEPHSAFCQPFSHTHLPKRTRPKRGALVPRVCVEMGLAKGGNEPHSAQSRPSFSLLSAPFW